MSGLRFIENMPNAEYHSGGGISKTTLDLAHKDVYAPEWAKKCPQDSEKIKTFDFGDAMHAICLEPHRLKSDFAVMPALNLRTNAGKEAKEEFLLENADKAILTDDDYKKLNLMFESIIAHPESRALIEAEGIAEGSYFWIDDATGLECKCRPDKHIASAGLLVDVKTTPDLSKFCYSVDDYRYYVQDPWYCDGVSRFGGQVRMEFLVIQKTIECGRYPVGVYRLPDEAIEYGRNQYRADLEKYARFLDSSIKPHTRELPMHYRFMERAYESLTEIEL